jgi:hypothetical protein
MLFSKNNLILNQYKNLTLTPILTSHFIYSTPEEIINLKAFRLELKSKKNQKLHFFYLWLLTGRLPYRRKFSSFLKTPSISLFKRVKTKIQYLQVKLKSRKKTFILSEILAQIISQQINSEKKVWTFQDQFVRTMIPFVPLTKGTFLLQPKNNYFLNLPLVLQFQFSKSTAFQKLFFLRFLQILASEQKIKGLDLI